MDEEPARTVNLGDCQGRARFDFPADLDRGSGQETKHPVTHGGAHAINLELSIHQDYTQRYHANYSATKEQLPNLLQGQIIDRKKSK